MNLFNKILRAIEKYIPFAEIVSQLEVLYSKGNESEIVNIENKLSKERIKILKFSIENRQRKIESLTDKQKKLIDQKCKILYISEFKNRLKIFNNLSEEIELLESNLILQNQINFNIEPVNTRKLTILSEGLKVVDYSKNLIPKLTEVRKNNKSKREEEIQQNENFKKEIFEFSLVKIHKLREEKRIKKERLEKEKKLNRQYQKSINNSKKALSNHKFTLAHEYLTEALSIMPKRKDEIKIIQHNVNRLENDYNDRKADFEKMFSSAENYFHDNELDQAIVKYKEALLLNIDNQKCNRRISDAQNKISRIRQLEEEQRIKEQAEKERREKYKDDADEIIAFYRKNGVSKFYHYTDTRNLNSILQNNGLLSLNEMNRKKIDYQQGSETYEMADYVRLSYTQNHPLLHVSKRQGRIRQEKTLEISLDVSGLKHTKFTNVNAARTSTAPIVIIGDDLNYIKKHVKMGVVMQRNHFDLSDKEKPYYQAEVMVKDHLPLDYIINL